MDMVVQSVDINRHEPQVAMSFSINELLITALQTGHLTLHSNFFI